MSDRDPSPLPVKQPIDAEDATAEPMADHFFGSSSHAPRSSASTQSSAEVQEEPFVPPRRNWDQLTYGGVGGWFKRLFSSSKRAQHRREIADRREAWSRAQQSLLDDEDYQPDLDLVQSNWAGRKLQSQQALITPEHLTIARRNPDSPDGKELLGKKQMLDRLDFFRTAAQGVDDAAIGPGPSAHRPAPSRGALKRSAPVAGGRLLSATQQAMIGNLEADRQSAFGAEEAAWQAVPSQGDFKQGWASGQVKMQEDEKSPENMKYIDAFRRSSRREKQGQAFATTLNFLDQGDLAFPEEIVHQEQGRQRALAFHQGYWKREQQEPRPTNQASHKKGVRFAQGDNNIEPLLNAPGNMVDEGEVVQFDEQGMPAQPRILPTGAYQYPAAQSDDTGMYAGMPSRRRTRFNREMAKNPHLLGQFAMDEHPVFSAWARKLMAVRERGSLSAKSRAQPQLPPDEVSRLEAQGAAYHQTRDEGLIQQQQPDPASGSEGASSQVDLDSNQAYGSEVDNNPGIPVEPDHRSEDELDS